MLKNEAIRLKKFSFKKDNLKLSNASSRNMFSFKEYFYFIGGPLGESELLERVNNLHTNKIR